MQTDCRNNKLDIIMKTLMIGLHKFLTRFSGRRRPQVKHEKHRRRSRTRSQSRPRTERLTASCCRFNSPTIPFVLILLVCAICDVTEACKSRAFIRHRQPTTTSPRPKIQHPIHNCHEDYARWYCLNNAKCFELRIGNDVIYNCECPDGYSGQRCDTKDPEGSYLNLSAPSRIIIIEEAGVAGGAMAICALLICIAGIVIWMKGSSVSRKYEFEVESQIGNDHRETSLAKSSPLTQTDQRQQQISDQSFIALKYLNGR